MTKFNYLMITAMFGISALVFTGCAESNEEDTSASELKLTGTWTYDDSEYVITVEGKDVKAWLIENGVTEQVAAEIISDLYEMLDDNFLAKGTLIEFNDEKVYTVSEPGEDSNEGTWELNESKTKIVFDNGEFDLDVVSMTSKIMKLTETMEEDYDLNEDETDEILTIERKIEFTK